MQNKRLMALAVMAAAAMPGMAGGAVATPNFGGRRPDPRSNGIAGTGRRSQESYRAAQRRKARGNPAGTKMGKAAHKARTSHRFADTFLASVAAKRITKAPLRDKHGAYTLVGSTYEVIAAEGERVKPTAGEHVFGGTFGNGGHTDYTARRKWLAGISAQRGY